MSNTLTVLADKYKCDKGSMKHGYTKQYGRHFGKDDGRSFNLLEIGFGKGASVKMWLEYFTNATVHCVDKDELTTGDVLINKYVNNRRFNFIKAAQIDVEVLFADVGDMEFRFIIDDGSHAAEDQQYCFGRLFPSLAPGGIYVIEDLNCRRSHNKKFKVKAARTVKVIHEYVKNGTFYSNVLSDDQLAYINNNTKDVSLYKDKIAFIQKK